MLIVGLVVGVGIGLLQALTQIQEATLVYAPKIVAIFVSLLIFLPLMGVADERLHAQYRRPHRGHVARPMEHYATAQQVYAARPDLRPHRGHRHAAAGASAKPSSRRGSGCRSRCCWPCV